MEEGEPPALAAEVCGDAIGGAAEGGGAAEAAGEVVSLLQACGLEKYAPKFLEKGFDDVGVITMFIDDVLNEIEMLPEEQVRLRSQLGPPVAAAAVPDAAAGGGNAAAADGAAQQAWLSRVVSRQQSQMTPEVRATIARRAAVSARAAKSSRRAERLQVCSAMTQQSWARGMRAQSLDAPSSTPALRSAAAESARDEMGMLQRVMSVEDDDEAEEQFGGQLMALQQVAQTEAADLSEIEALLRQLMTDPADDAERVAKFGLYEGLMETVEAARKTTFEFYDGCKVDFLEAGGESVQAAIERNLAAIDGGDNMAVDFREDRWFVYDMTRKLDSNNAMLGRVLQDIKTKLDLIAQQDDCPICLDSMDGMAANDVKVLGCCHKVCGECWAQWQAIKHGQAFCPLCKHEEFLTDVCEGQALPAELFRRVQEAVSAEAAVAPEPAAAAPLPAEPALARAPHQNSWPELVGQSGADAVSAIMAARPDLAQVVAMDESGMMTMDFRGDRVRVMVDAATGVVTSPPTIG